MTRNPGIDLCKALAVAFVVLHHTIDCGYTVAPAAGGALRTLWLLLHGVFYTCINLFALATGYLCVNSKNTAKRLPQLWLQTVFIGLACAAAATVTCRSAGCQPATSPVTLVDWLRAVFPVVTGEYWYFSAYVLLALFAPFLNPGIRALEKRAFQRILGALILLIGIASVTATGKSDPFVLKTGYSFAWLAVMYLAGAYWRLHINTGLISQDLQNQHQNQQNSVNFVQDSVNPVKSGWYWCLLAIAVGLAALFIPSAGKRLFAGAVGEWFGQMHVDRYTSPFNVAISLGIFGLCQHLRIPFFSRRDAEASETQRLCNEKPLCGSATSAPLREKYVAKATLLLQWTVQSVAGKSFGIYLWLVNPVFWRLCWKPYLAHGQIATLGEFALRIPATFLCAFGAAWLLEFLRAALFAKVAKIASSR